MEHSLSLFSLLLGAAGWVGAVLMERSNRVAEMAGGVRSDVRKTSVWCALGLALVVLLSTLPSRPPFAPGASFGLGYCLGTVLLLASLVLRTRDSESPPLALMWAGVLAAALPGAFTTGDGHFAALMGAATGLGAGALLVAVGAGEKSVTSRLLPVALLLGLAACSLAMLGVLRAALSSAPTPQDPGLWSATGVAVAAVAAAGVSAGHLASLRELATPGFLARFSSVLWNADTPMRAVGLLVASVVTLLGTSLLALRFLEEPSLVVVTGLGIAAGLLILVLSRETSNGGRSGFASPFAALVMLGAFMAAFGTLQGFGGAALMVGVTVPLAFAPPGRSGTAVKVALFGLCLVLYRVFVSRYAEALHGVSLSDNYALFAILAGALLPHVPATLARDGEEFSLPRLFAAGLVGLAAPGTLLFFYGAKAGPSFMVGLALSAAMRGAAFASLWSVLICLAVLEGTGHLLPLADLSRIERLKLLALVTCGTAVVLVLADLSARHRRRA